MIDSVTRCTSGGSSSRSRSAPPSPDGHDPTRPVGNDPIPREMISSSLGVLSPDGEDARRVGDREVVDLGGGDAAGPEAGQEGLLEVGVAVAVVVAELLVVADVLAEEDAVRVAAGQKLQQQIDDARLAMALHRREGHAEEVEL